MANEPTILITGASRGLGAAAARAAGQMGANVVLMARTAGALESVEKEIRSAKGQAVAIPGNVSSVADCRQIVARTFEQFGRLDAVINNAGILQPIAAISDIDPGDWERNLATNLTGPLLLTQAALPALRATKGTVVNVSAGAAVKVIPGWSAYSSAKAALNHFTRILAAEEPEITAITFRPGAINTDMQTTIRDVGAEGMSGDMYDYFVRAYENETLLPPEVPGCALAVLAFHAPHEWSGQFLPWNHETVQSLVRRFACSSST